MSTLIESLVQPISEESPAGENLVYTEVDQEIVDLASAAMKSGSKEEWKLLADRIVLALKNQTKDVRYLAHYIRARTAIDGYPGFYQGLCLATQSIKIFRESLFPPADIFPDGSPDYSSTYMFLSQLDGRSMQQLLNLCPLAGSTGDLQLGTWHYRESLSSSSLSDNELQERRRLGIPTEEEFQQAIYDTRHEDLYERWQAISAAKEELSELPALVQDITGQSLLSFRETITILDTAQDCLNSLAGNVLDSFRENAADPEATDSAEESEQQITGSSQKNTQPAMSSGNVINSRQDAFRLLEKVADYFQKAEPQSFLPSHIRRAIKWGNMSAEELYQELLDDESARQQLFRLTGIRETNHQE